jgi:hypothetical protein
MSSSRGFKYAVSYLGEGGNRNEAVEVMKHYARATWED